MCARPTLRMRQACGAQLLSVDSQTPSPPFFPPLAHQQGVSLTGETPPLSEQARVLDSVGSSEGAVIPLLEIGVLAFPGGAEEFLIFELRYRRLIKSLLEGMRAPRVFGLTAGGVGTLVTLGSYNVMPDG